MRNYTNEFLKKLVGKKIIIAGSNGYIGTEIANQLDLNKIRYIGIDKTCTNKVNDLNFNLTDTKKVIDAISAEKPDYLFHIGTHSALAYKNNLLDTFYEDNTALHNIVQALRKSNNAQLIYFSSSYVYSGLDCNKKVNEKTILTPKHNFGFAKLFFEQLILRLYPSSIIFRLSSVFGKGKYLHPNAIEVMAQEAMNDKILTIWGKGTRKMQYIFIEDVVKFMLKAPDLQSGIYNLSSHSYDTVMATANYIAEYFGVNIKTLPDKKEGETLPLMDNKKLIDALDQDYFSDHRAALNKYLDDISNIQK